MNGTRLQTFAGVVLVAALAGCSASPEKPADNPAQPSRMHWSEAEKPFIASGNEPFWRVILEPGQLVLERPNQPTEELRYETVSRSDTGRRYQASREGLSIDLITASQLCRDSMTGMPHPFQVRLSINGDSASGCGGDPERLLMGAEWVVEDIGGRGIIDKSRVTMRFLPDGKIAGLGSCNRYMGSWSLNGETLELSKLASTRKACPPALMDQEGRFLKQLESVRSFDISPQGALLISAGSQAPIRAFQATR